jgi:RHS repeat-associated protein
VRVNASSDSATATYDAQDRLRRLRDTTCTYTASGALSAKVSAAGTITYTYDPLTHLIAVALPNADSITYIIDGVGRRVMRKLNGTVTHRWLYQDQIAPVAEFDGAGNLVTRYVYGSRRDVPDYMIKGGITYRIITDHIGSVRLAVSTTTGAVVQRMDFGPFGRLTLDTNPGFQCFGYAGGMWDAASGLVRLGARDYDPGAGRWTCRDPMLLEAGTNMYSYVNNNPITSTDPTGLCTIQLGLSVSFTFPFGVAGGVSAGVAADRMGHLSTFRTYGGGVAAGGGASGGVLVAV